MNPNAQPRRVLAAVLFALMLAPVSSALLDEDQGFQPSPRGAGYLWGEDVTQKFLHENGLQKIFRAHQLVMEVRTS